MKLKILKKRFLLPALLVAGIALTTAAAAFTATFDGGPVGYSGRLLDNSGDPVADGTYPMVVEIYDASTNGTLLYKQEYASATVEDGYFNILLFEGVDAAEAATDVDDALSTGWMNRYLQLTVDGEVMAPRQAITASPWSILVKP